MTYAFQWEKFNIKKESLASKLAFYLACQILGLWPPNLQFVPSSCNLSNREISTKHSRDILYAKINELRVACADHVVVMEMAVLVYLQQRQPLDFSQVNALLECLDCSDSESSKCSCGRYSLNMQRL